MNYDWNFSALFSGGYIDFLLRGFWLSIEITAWSLLFGTVLGILIGTLASLGSSLVSRIDGQETSLLSWSPVRLAQWIVRYVSYIYIDVVRAIPLLLFVLMVYYGLPFLLESAPVSFVLAQFGLDPLQLSPYICAIIAFAVNLSAFAADLVRAGVGGVPTGSIRAARSLGMTVRQTWSHIVLPEITRTIFPSMVLLYITIFKMSTLASVIAIYEVLHSADAVIQKTYRPLEVYLVVSLLFVVTIVPLTIWARQQESAGLLIRRS